MTSLAISSKAAPGLDIPPSDSVVTVRIINTTTDMSVRTEAFMQPTIKGLETINLPTFSFVMENKKLGKTVLFDAGSRKDWWNFTPLVRGNLEKAALGLDIRKNVNEILEEGGLDLRKISSIIWSHWHWDHIGDPSQFPSSAELVVGPGVKNAFIPGYPTNPKAPLLDSDFTGREIREISFPTDMKIGRFPAVDFFGDGSLYLLDVPGHAVGHMCALARTTFTTFVFMGGDVCHWGGVFRPTPYVPLPIMIPKEAVMGERIPTPCPCSIFMEVHPAGESSRDRPFSNVSHHPDNWYIDSSVAQESVDALEEFDANENVFVAIAHDAGLIPVVDWFPDSLNEWKSKGWKERSRWNFLKELPSADGSIHRDELLLGWTKEGHLYIP